MGGEEPPPLTRRCLLLQKEDASAACLNLEKTGFSIMRAERGKENREMKNDPGKNFTRLYPNAEPDSGERVE